jgi:hypothetical protein
MRELATRYSEACTRAGIAALATAAFTFTVSQRLASVEYLNAFGSYVLGRELLDIALSELMGSDNWPAIVAELDTEHRTGESIQVGELARLECLDDGGLHKPKPSTSGAVPTQITIPIAIGDSQKKADKGAAVPASTVGVDDAGKSAPAPDRRPMPPSAANARPLPPTVTLNLVIPCPGVEELKAALKRLSDDTVLWKARALSGGAESEVYRWQLANYRAFLRNSRSSSDVPAPFHEQHLRLQIAQLRALNLQPRTTVREYTDMLRERILIGTPYSSITQGAGTAALLAQLVSVVLVAYFLLNVLAARSRSVLFAPGTLFGTTCANLFGKFFIALLLGLPAACSIHMAARIGSEHQFAASALSSVIVGLTLVIYVLLAPQLVRVWAKQVTLPVSTTP